MTVTGLGGTRRRWAATSSPFRPTEGAASMSAFQTRVVIVGAGFAGLSAAKALRRVPVQVTVVDQHDYHTFKPFLYQVATALLGADASAYPTRGEVLRLANVSFRLGAVTGVDLAAKEAETDRGRLFL